ncbi:MAG: TetR family transcriptional regulator [Actinophytocola sp.]|nr:TetR family transcriptional regulator [Actinophytocola sp.]
MARRTTDKRTAMLEGALVILARDGYTRASIDAIAAEADVSTRTIYNHFGDKAGLFEAVIEHSADRVAEAQLAVIDRHLWKVTDIETDLRDFGRAWATAIPEYADHFALVRQINAERGHIPDAAIERWQQTGPRRVRSALAARMKELSDRGLLKIDDPDLAALHFALLVSANDPSQPGVALADHDLDTMVDAGVHAFLHGYGG